MVNDEKYINEVLERLKKVSKEELDEAIKKVDMEEDIKILEDETNALGLFFKCNGTGKYKQALENLLKRYKELEEENKKYPIKLNDEIYRRVIENAQKEFIPISVIQNKIDEITKYRDIAKELIEYRVVIADSDSLNYGRAEAHDKDIQVLQELLEERK